jgi:hypothetical protein
VHTLTLALSFANTVRQYSDEPVIRAIGEAGTSPEISGTFLTLLLLAIATATLVAAMRIMSQLLGLMLKLMDLTVRTGFTLALTAGATVLVIMALLLRT